MLKPFGRLQLVERQLVLRGGERRRRHRREFGGGRVAVRTADQRRAGRQCRGGGAAAGAGAAAAGAGAGAGAAAAGAGQAPERALRGAGAGAGWRAGAGACAGVSCGCWASAVVARRASVAASNVPRGTRLCHNIPPECGSPVPAGFLAGSVRHFDPYVQSGRARFGELLIALHPRVTCADRRKARRPAAPQAPRPRRGAAKDDRPDRWRRRRR